MSEHERTQKLAKAVHDRGRRAMLRALAPALKGLDEVHERDAAAIKERLGRLLERAGFAARRADKLIDEVLEASRAERIALVESAVRQAATAGRELDRKTFDAVFGEDPPDPKAGRASASKRRRGPRLRLVDESEDGSSGSH